MTGFELRITGVRSNRSTNTATTTAQGRREFNHRLANKESLIILYTSLFDQNLISLSFLYLGLTSCC